MDISFCSFSFNYFWLAYCLSHLISTTTGTCKDKPFPLNTFNKCSWGKGFSPQNEHRVQSIKDSFPTASVFQQSPDSLMMTSVWEWSFERVLPTPSPSPLVSAQTGGFHHNCELLIFKATTDMEAENGNRANHSATELTFPTKICLMFLKHLRILHQENNHVHVGYRWHFHLFLLYKVLLVVPRKILLSLRLFWRRNLGIMCTTISHEILRRGKM